VSIALGIGFLVSPLIVIVANSIGENGLALFPPNSFRLDAYFNIPAQWWWSFLNSLVLASSAAAAACVLGTLAALALARGGFVRRSVIDGLLRSPLQMPSLVIGIAFLQFYSWLNVTAGVDLRGSFMGLLIAHTTVSVPYVLTIVLARLVTFDERLEEAAVGLGATNMQALLRVTLPIINPAILSGGFFAFLLSLDNVPISLFLVSAATPLLPVDLFNSIQFDLTRQIYAVATLVCLMTTIAIVVLYRRLTSTVAIQQM
jgi:putative spermidine/putrescine transport system permease protein